MDRRTINFEEILARAATQHITAQELDLLVAKTRELSKVRERELKHLQQLLDQLEAHLDPH
ncbi:hypothetical protein [Oceanicoccus sp. KOV_DT_Chl]|uniref:hypothetical protein n=1 Tax=Oceanicoccus sp. KOV_DT_Chl TaxID=1904639 RepID=UPI000C7AD132|nr:hypothetical protein [Oceanicoccus sp. KOV_DT_Chl]